MTLEEAIMFAEHAQTMTDIPEVKDFYAMAENALRTQKQNQGKWEFFKDTAGTVTYTCSECRVNNTTRRGRVHKYCPNCGSRNVVSK